MRKAVDEAPADDVKKLGSFWQNDVALKITRPTRRQLIFYQLNQILIWLMNDSTTLVHEHQLAVCQS